MPLGGAEGTAPTLTSAAELRARRKEAKRAKAKKPRDDRGLAFYGLKGPATQDVSQEENAGGLKRSVTKDDEGNLWEFKETLGVRRLSTVEREAALDPDLDGKLVELLQEAKLLDKLPEARKWCAENGASFIQEVYDEREDFSKALGLSPGAAARLETAVSKHGPEAEAPSTTLAAIGRATSNVASGTGSLLRRMSTGIGSAVGTLLPRTSTLTRAPSISVDQLTERASSQGLGRALSTTRTLSYLQGQVSCQETKVGIIDPGGVEEEDDDDEETDEEDEVEQAEEPDEEEEESISGLARFTRAVNGVLFGVRASRLAKEKREAEEWEIYQLEQKYVEPAPEEEALDGRSALAKLAEYKAPPGGTCLTLIAPAGTVGIDSLIPKASGKRARKYIQLVAASLAGSEVPPNGLAVFMKINSMKDDSTNDLIAIEPPAPLKTFSLSDGPVFATEILSGLFIDTTSTGCTVISGEECLLYRFFQDHGQVEARIQPRLQKRQKKGGQSALRIARLAEEVRAAYVRITAERVNEVFVGEEGMNVDMVIIGGSAELADNLYASDHLDYRIKQTMKRATEIKETDYQADVRKKALAVRNQEEAASLLAALRECEEKSHTDLVAYGLKDVMKRIGEYNIRTLMYAVGAGLPTKLVEQAQEIGGVHVYRVPEGIEAHENLTRKWGGAFAMLQWTPQDYDDDA